MESPQESVPKCRSCEFNLPIQFYLAREFRSELHCRKQMVTYPDAHSCPYYRREPGAD